MNLGEKACKNCRMISAGPVCPNCKSTNLSDDWTGLVIVIDPNNSEIAKKMVIKIPGKYAIRVR
jgi:DNA-directed RNA polymerase subunit E"